MELFGIRINGTLQYIICQSKAGACQSKAGGFYWKTATKIKFMRKNRDLGMEIEVSEYKSGSYCDSVQDAIVSAIENGKNRRIYTDDSTVERENNLPKKENHLFQKKAAPDPKITSLAAALWADVPATAEEHDAAIAPLINAPQDISHGSEMPKLQPKRGRK